MAQVQVVWKSLNPRERLSAIGAGLIVLAWIVGLLSYGAGASTVALLGAIAVLAIFYIKYTPTIKVTWPADVSLIVLGISAIVALIELIDLLRIFPALGYIGSFAGGLIVTILLEVAGAAVMVWGAWQEYQLVKPATPDWMGGATSTTPPPAAPASPPPAAPPVAPPAAPPASSPVDNTDEAPPA